MREIVQRNETKKAASACTASSLHLAKRRSRVRRVPQPGVRVLLARLSDRMFGH